MTDQWRKKCPAGCTCGKHRPRLWSPDCTCSRHEAEWKRKKCEAGCTCGRHRVQRCDPGCTCSRHRPSWNRYTEEQRTAAAERRRAIGREYMRQRRRAHPEYREAQRERNKLHGRRYSLKHKFGISEAQWDDLLIAQSGRCYLCSDPLDPEHIHVDHSHACCPGDRSCGLCIRGLACQWCNQGVGQFRDDPDRMRRAAAALEAAEALVTIASPR